MPLKRLFAIAALSALSACAAPTNDPVEIDKRRCRSEAEGVRMQVEQQESNSAPRVLGPSGSLPPSFGVSGGFAAYSSAYSDCLRARAAERGAAGPPAKP